MGIGYVRSIVGSVTVEVEEVTVEVTVHFIQMSFIVYCLLYLALSDDISSFCLTEVSRIRCMLRHNDHC